MNAAATVFPRKSARGAYLKVSLLGEAVIRGEADLREPIYKPASLGAQSTGRRNI